jgi:Domain of Unknown Function (DUF748)
MRNILLWLQRHCSPRSLRWWQWLIVFGIGVWMLGRSWLPGFIRQQVVTNLTAMTTAQVTLGDVDLNLLRGYVALQRLSFTLPEEKTPVFAVRSVEVNLRLRSLLRRTINIEDLTLTGVQVAAVQEPNGQLNLSRLFPPTPPEQQPKEPTEPADLPTLSIGEVEIVDSAITYQDRTRQGEPRFEFAITDLTTETIDLQPRGLAAPVAIQLEGTLNQSPLQGKAAILWHREQTSVDADIGLQQLALAALEPYLRDSLAFQKLNGRLGAQLHYHYQSGGTALAHALSGTATVENLEVVDPLSQQTALTLPKGQIDIETVDLARQDIRITSVELRDLRLFVSQTPTGLNLASLVQTTNQEQTSTASPWRFALKTVKWTGGELQYRDSTWPEAETLTLSPEELELHNLGGEATEHPFRLRSRLGEGTIAGEGTLQLSPFAMQGQFQPANIDMAVFRPMLTALLPGQSVQGKVSGSIRAALDPQNTEGTVRFDGTLETTQFLLDGIPEAGGTVSWESGRITISEGSTATPLSLHLEPQLARVRVQRPPQTDLAIEQVSGTVTLTSPTVTEGQPPLRFSGALATTQLTLSGIPEAANVLAWDSSQIDIRDGSTLTPLALDLTTRFVKVSLQRLPQGDVAIENATATLRLAQEESPQQEPRIRVQGPVDLTGFVLTHGPEKKILLGCYHATATIAEGSHLVPFDVRVPDVALEYTYAQGMRSSEGRFQLVIPPVQVAEGTPDPSAAAFSTVPAPLTNAPATEPLPVATQTAAPELAATAPPEAQPTTSTSGLALRMDRVSIIGGELYFEDRTVTPPQTVYWQDVRVNVTTLSYPLVFPATFSAFAYNEDGAPVEFQGVTEKEGAQTVMRVHGNIRKLSLARFNAYLEPSLGYRVKKGKVTATWDLVLPGDRIQANMTVTLHNIGLGGKRNQSQLEQQVGLPLALVIGLLKDLNGDIALHLPMEGKLNEPGFQWGGTIARAVRDVLIGAVTSPRKLLGAVFKGNEELEDFTFQPLQFIPGTSDMTKDAKAQLGQLSQFLAQRPGLDIRMSGMIGETDLSNLKDLAILNQLPPAPLSPPEQPKSTTEASPSAPPPPLPLTAQDEVARFLTHQLHPANHPEPVTLSEPATTLLAQLRQQATVPAEAQERLIQTRIQKVTTVLTTQHGVATTRIRVHPEKQRGAGAPEVRYVLQTRENETEEARETPPRQQAESHKGAKL